VPATPKAVPAPLRTLERPPPFFPPFPGVFGRGAASVGRARKTNASTTDCSAMKRMLKGKGGVDLMDKKKVVRNGL
jgi:hypothetical protein